MPNLFTTKGRIPRSTYWIFFIVFYGICALLGYAFDSGKVSELQKAIVTLLFLPFVFMGLIVQIKRWHDRNKSGWWVLINLVPCFGALWSFIECGFLKGTTGENRFGPDPMQ